MIVILSDNNFDLLSVTQGKRPGYHEKRVKFWMNTPKKWLNAEGNLVGVEFKA